MKGFDNGWQTCAVQMLVLRATVFGEVQSAVAFGSVGRGSAYSFTEKSDGTR